MSSGAFEPLAAALADPSAAYHAMLERTKALLNKLMHLPRHYEAARRKRDREVVVLLMVVASLRTRLETVVSPDKIVHDVLEYVDHKIELLPKASDDEWRAAYNERQMVQLIEVCLFSQADVQTRPELRVPGVEPIGFDVLGVFRAFVEPEPASGSPDDLIGALLARDVRRLCTSHIVLAQKWASALAIANRWRIYVANGVQAREVDLERRDALGKVDSLRKALGTFIESFSKELDETPEADDLEARAAFIGRSFNYDRKHYEMHLDTHRERVERSREMQDRRQRALGLE